MTVEWIPMGDLHTKYLQCLCLSQQDHIWHSVQINWGSRFFGTAKFPDFTQFSMMNFQNFRMTNWQFQHFDLIWGISNPVFIAMKVMVMSEVPPERQKQICSEISKLEGHNRHSSSNYENVWTRNRLTPFSLGLIKFPDFFLIWGIFLKFPD